MNLKEYFDSINLKEIESCIDDQTAEDLIIEYSIVAEGMNLTNGKIERKKENITKFD